MEAKQLDVLEQVSASKKLGVEHAKKIATEAKRIVVAKGKKVTAFDAPDPGDADLIAAMLGSTGNLRAPLIRSGSTVFIGFNEEALEDYFG